MKKSDKELKEKNQLEGLCYQYRQTLTDEKLKDKFTDDDKKQINEKTDEALKWSTDHPAASKEEYDAKIKELEGIFNPIMMRVYQASGGMPGQGGMPNMNFGGQGAEGQGTTQGTSKSNVDDVD